MDSSLGHHPQVLVFSLALYGTYYTIFHLIFKPQSISFEIREIVYPYRIQPLIRK